MYSNLITWINPIEYSNQIEKTEVTNNILRLHWITDGAATTYGKRKAINCRFGRTILMNLCF